MEALMEKLSAYGRYLELSDDIPYWESQVPELKERIKELEWNRWGKETELAGLQEPTFFQRLFGKVEEKKEKLHQQLSRATAAWNAAKWELEDLEKKINAGKETLEALSYSREDYEAAKQNAALTSAQESQLMMAELTAFTPAAISAADRCLEALEDARFWMQEDAVRKGVRDANQKMACLARAEENAVRLVQILSIMPEGAASVGRYLRSPEGYVDAVTSEFARLDRLNNAISQVRETRNQLRMLQ